MEPYGTWTLHSRVILMTKWWAYTHRKKGTETVPLGCYCYKQHPFFQRGAKRVLLGAPNYGQPNSTTRGAVSAPFFSECRLGRQVGAPTLPLDVTSCKAYSAWTSSNNVFTHAGVGCTGIYSHRSMFYISKCPIEHPFQYYHTCTFRF